MHGVCCSVYNGLLRASQSTFNYSFNSLKNYIRVHKNVQTISCQRHFYTKFQLLFVPFWTLSNRRIRCRLCRKFWTLPWFPRSCPYPWIASPSIPRIHRSQLYRPHLHQIQWPSLIFRPPLGFGRLSAKWVAIPWLKLCHFHPMNIENKLSLENLQKTSKKQDEN